MNDLILIPDLKFPLKPQQVDPLLVNTLKFNTLDAGVDPRSQKAIDILLHIYDLLVKSNGAFDYTGQKGHAQLYQDAVTLIPEFLASKIGDLRAAHLSLDYSNTQIKLKEAGLPLLPTTPGELLNMCRDILNTPLRTDERMSLLLNYLAKKSL